MRWRWGPAECGAVPSPFGKYVWPTSWLVDFWRGFLEDQSEGSWAWRVRVAVAGAEDMFEVMDHWVKQLRASASAVQDRTLRNVRRDLDRLESDLEAIDTIAESTEDPSAVWAGAALPLAYGTASVFFRLASIRNQLATLQFSDEAVWTFDSSKGIEHYLPSWKAPVPEWAEQQLRNTIEGVVTQTELSPPGEGPTTADVLQGWIDRGVERLRRTFTRVKAKVVRKETIPWVVLGLAALYLWKKR